MKKTKMRGLSDTILHQILGEYHAVLNQHAQVMNQQWDRIAALHHRLQAVEAAAGILPEDAALPVVEGVVDETAPPLTEEQVEMISQEAIRQFVGDAPAA